MCLATSLPLRNLERVRATGKVKPARFESVVRKPLYFRRLDWMRRGSCLFGVRFSFSVESIAIESTVVCVPTLGDLVFVLAESLGDLVFSLVSFLLAMIELYCIKWNRLFSASVLHVSVKLG